MRILVVEDEPALREQLAAQLKQRGYSVDAAEDGETGLYLGREYPMDLAIIDLGLPRMSGIDVIRELRCLMTISGFERRQITLGFEPAFAV